MGLSACGPEIGFPANNKVLLLPSLVEKERLLARMGFTNILSHGPVERNSAGTEIFVTVETGTSSNPIQQSRIQHLIIVTAQGARVTPWHFPANEKVDDHEKVAVWQHPKPDYRWEVRSGQVLPEGCNVEAQSGDWIAISAPGRAPWIAKLDAPMVAAAELPDSPGLIEIFAKGQMVHVFARQGWRRDEGQMKYLVYDFSQNSKLISNTTIPWARIALDMDPETQCAVLNDRNRFWERTWLFNLGTGKRRAFAQGDWTLIVTKDVAGKWIELTKP